jgi:uncharacterized integral membrane protein (TIGR00698 family)
MYLLMKFAYFTDWAMMGMVACGALLLSKLVVVSGSEPLEPALLALSIGMLMRSRGAARPACEAGSSRAERTLVAGIALTGAELNLVRLVEDGAAILAVIVVTMLAGFAAIHALGRMFRLPRALALLLSVGTTICGGTAIAIVAPILRAPEDETSYAIGTISLWSLAAILIYPLVAHRLGIADVAFGVFAGTAIHSTPQVVGAGFIYSEVAGQTATAVKLVRSCFIAPVVLALAVSPASRPPAADSPAALSEGRAPSDARAQLLRASRVTSLWRIFPWFLFGFFVLAGASSLGLIHGAAAAWMGAAGELLMLIGMAGVGLNTNLGGLVIDRSRERPCRMGLRPLAVGLLGSLVVALVSGSMIRLVLAE